MALYAIGDLHLSLTRQQVHGGVRPRHGRTMWTGIERVALAI